MAFTILKLVIESGVEHAVRAGVDTPQPPVAVIGKMDLVTSSNFSDCWLPLWGTPVLNT